MKVMEKELHLNQISKIEAISSDFSRLADDYVFTRVAINPQRGLAPSVTMRFDGMVFLLCRRGKLTIDINLTPNVISEGMVLCIPPQSVFSTHGDEDWSGLDADILFLSQGFLHSIALDLNTLATTGIPFGASDNSKGLLLNDQEMELLEKYFDLFHMNTIANNVTTARSIARTLMAAILYQLVSIKVNQKDNETETQPFSRRLNYVSDFMKLVRENFRKERSVGFYAERLYISPKYLSLVIKEVTGKSAAAWIDECVILEAKNLLKFSGKNVQQIAYELNFNDQSSFGKYFKHLTGMSPSKFQRS